MNEGDDIQVVTFRVGGQEFAFDILQVERILRYDGTLSAPEGARLPGGSDAVWRWCRSRPRPAEAVRAGGVHPRGDPADDPRAGEQRVAVLVDEVREVMRVDTTTITAPGPS